jgi:RNA polymerase primary sigma factor
MTQVIMNPQVGGGGELLLKRRVEELLRTEIDFIMNPSFQGESDEWERRVMQTPLELTDATGATPRDLPGHLARLCEARVLNAEEERDLFRRMNYLKYRANVLRTQLDPENPDPDRVERTERLLAAANAIREQLLKANMRLAISIVKKFVTPRNSFDDLLSDGIYSLMQAVDKFDYERGFRFSTYAYRAIARNAYRSITKRQKEWVRFASDMEEGSTENLADEPREGLDIKSWERLRQLMSQLLHRLDRREQMIVRCRYALGGHRKVKTFQAIAEKLGISKERVRQLEQRAMCKLRNMAAELDLEEVAEPSLS